LIQEAPVEGGGGGGFVLSAETLVTAGIIMIAKINNTPTRAKPSLATWSFLLELLSDNTVKDTKAYDLHSMLLKTFSEQ